MAIAEFGGTNLHIPAGKLSPQDYTPTHVSEIENIQFTYLSDKLDQIKRLTNKDYATIFTPHGYLEVIAIVRTAHRGQLPKSDFILVLRNGDWYHISHKGITHQQLGGVSHAYHSPVYLNFEAAILKLGYNGVPPGQAFARMLSLDKPEERHLICQSLFGKQYDSLDHGPNNIHLILHGEVELMPFGNYHELTASRNVVANHPSLQDDLTKLGPYFMVASYRGDRDSNLLKNTRTQVSGPSHRNMLTLRWI